jgi:hypothetical protein
MLNKEIILDKNTGSAYNTSFTFGQINKKDIITIYCLLESENILEYFALEEVLRNLLKRGLDSIKLVLIVGMGGVIPDLSSQFDIRLGNVVISKMFAKGLDPGVAAMYKFRGQVSWWARKAVAKLESQQLMRTGSRWYDAWPKRLPSSAQAKFTDPVADILYSRSYDHSYQGPRGHGCGKCSNTEIVSGRARSLKTPVVYIGNTFVIKDDFGIPETLRGHRAMKEWTAKPLVFMKNGATVVVTFPCIIVYGVSNY